MDSRTKVAYGLAVSSLAIALLCAKATADRIGTGKALVAAEGAVIALAALEARCDAAARIDWIEDEFADAMQDQGRWCQGPVAQVMARWDSSRTYQFRGMVSFGPGLAFSWSRLPELTAAQQATERRLKAAVKDGNTVGAASLSLEVLLFEQAPPLVQSHELWLASGHLINLNFGERMLADEWVAHLSTDQSAHRIPYTVAGLREYVLAQGLRASVSGKEPESVYRELLKSWSTQSVKVPLLNLDLKYAHAVIALAGVAVLQLLWLARAVGGAKVEDDPQLYSRLSLTRQIADASSGGAAARVIAVLDWLSLWACGTLALATPAICFACALLAYQLDRTELASVYVTGALAGLSIALSGYVLRRAQRLLHQAARASAA